MMWGTGAGLRRWPALLGLVLAGVLIAGRGNALAQGIGFHGGVTVDPDVLLGDIVLGDLGVPAVGGVVYLWAVLLGLGGFLVMTVTVLYGVTRMPVHRSAVILLFELVAGAVSSMLLTDEIVLAREWLGGALIVMAAWLAARIHAVNSE